MKKYQMIEKEPIKQNKKKGDDSFHLCINS